MAAALTRVVGRLGFPPRRRASAGGPRSSERRDGRDSHNDGVAAPVATAVRLARQITKLLLQCSGTTADNQNVITVLRYHVIATAVLR